MSRRRRERIAAAAKDRLSRLEALRDQLAEVGGFALDALTPADRLRVDQAAFAVLVRDNLQRRALAGEPVDLGEIERITACLNNVLPAPRARRLDIHFVDHTDLCIKCRAPLPSKEDCRPDITEAASAVEAKSIGEQSLLTSADEVIK